METQSNSNHGAEAPLEAKASLKWALDGVEDLLNTVGNTIGGGVIIGCDGRAIPEAEFGRLRAECEELAEWIYFIRNSRWMSGNFPH